MPPELPALFPDSASSSSQAPLAAVLPMAELPCQAQPRSALRGSLAGPVPRPIPSLPARLLVHGLLLRGLSQRAAMKGTDSWGLCLPRLLASLMDTLPSPHSVGDCTVGRAGGEEAKLPLWKCGQSFRAGGTGEGFLSSQHSPPCSSGSWHRVLERMSPILAVWAEQRRPRPTLLPAESKVKGGPQPARA